MNKFRCQCDTSCQEYAKCRKVRMVLRPCGRANPSLGDQLKLRKPLKRSTKRIRRRRPSARNRDIAQFMAGYRGERVAWLKRVSPGRWA